MFSSIRALARLVVLDGLRRHALIGLILFALAGVTGGLLFFDFIPRDIGRASNDFLFSIIWLTGFIFLLFHAVQVVAWDNDRGVLSTYLARPVSRIEYGLGLFVGLAILLFALNSILGGLGWWMLKIVKTAVDAAYFQNLSFVSFLLSSAGLYFVQLMLLSVILFFSSVVRGSFSVLLLTLCYYFICSSLPVVRESLSQQMFHGGENHEFYEILLRCMTAIFPDFSRLDFKGLVTSTTPIPIAGDLMLPFVMALFYVGVVLWSACIVYERRDLQ